MPIDGPPESLVGKDLLIFTDLSILIKTSRLYIYANPATVELYTHKFESINSQHHSAQITETRSAAYLRQTTTPVGMVGKARSIIYCV